MSEININAVLAIFTALVLFLFAIESFGKELEHSFKDKIKPLIAKATRGCFLSLLTGAIATGLLQSSSAVSVIIVSLVSSKIMNLQQAIGILLGTNIGTTFTAQLIAFKLTNIAPYFLVVGYFLNFAKGKVGMWGKPLFYFGLLFFGLNLLSKEVSILQDHPFIKDWLLNTHNPYLGLLIGAVLTALLQSSSVMTGLIIIFSAQGLLNFDLAVPLLIGSNVGTTITAIFASFNLGVDARRAAAANLLINFAGLVLFTPFLIPFTKLMQSSAENLGQQVANAHLAFNLTIVVVLLPFSSKLAQIVESKIK
jgi:phosphate:Na+ symporter